MSAHGGIGGPPAHIPQSNNDFTAIHTEKWPFWEPWDSNQRLSDSGGVPRRVVLREHSCTRWQIQLWPQPQI